MTHAVSLNIKYMIFFRQQEVNYFSKAQYAKHVKGVPEKLHFDI